MQREPWRALAAILAVSCVANAAVAQTPVTHVPSPPGARVYFQSPTDGAIVGPTFTVRAGLQGMGVAPAGEAVPHAGHHHLLIDAPLIHPDESLPVNNRIVHFSNGETETQVSLAPGRHTLQLVLGDANHMNFAPPVFSKPITIIVRKH